MEVYPLVMNNSLPWKISMFKREIIYFYGRCSMAMLNNQRV